MNDFLAWLSGTVTGHAVIAVAFIVGVAVLTVFVIWRDPPPPDDSDKAGV